jgi:hypothetical protein
MNVACRCRTLAGVALAACVALLPAGCKDLLNVNDPDIVIELPATPGAALALKNGAFRRLAEAVSGTQGPDALFVFGGLITDEWRSGDTFVQRNNQDQRIFDPTNTFNAGPFRNLNRARIQAEIAIGAIRDLVPDSLAAVGIMFGVVAYVETLIGEHYCNGTPLSEPDPVTPGAIIYGQPLTNDSVFGLARAQADSALAVADLLRRLADSLLLHADTALAQGDTVRARADSALARQHTTESRKVGWFASVLQGRALLNRGQFAQAAAVVAAVPDTFRFQVTHSITVNENQIWGLNNDARRYTLVNREGGLGLDFVTAADPRLPTRTGGTGSGGRIFDTQTPISVVRQGIWGRTSAVNIVTGIEARLIEAEAALKAGDFTAWLNIVNALRTNPSLYPPREAPEGEPPNWAPPRGTVLPALALPATDSLRVFTHFRERAFWLFSTGHRLADMRRLVRPVAVGGYGWDPAGVYPGGSYYKGGTYGTALQMSVPFQEQNNPNFRECLNLDP